MPGKRSAERRERRRDTTRRDRVAIPLIDPVCLECESLAELVGGERIYPHRKDLWGKKYFLCKCGAYVGVHPGTEVPLGYPCGPETRRARNAVHAIFDPLWERKIIRDQVPRHVAREAGYVWLAEQLDIPRRDCHVSHFNKATCERAVAIIKGATGR